MSKFSTFVIGFFDKFFMFLEECFTVYPVESIIVVFILLFVFLNGLINFMDGRTFFRGIRKEY